MEKGRGVNEFDAGGQALMPVALVAAEPGRGQGHHRPDALAAGGHNVTGQLRDQRHRAVHRANDELVHVLQVLFSES